MRSHLLVLSSVSAYTVQFQEHRGVQQELLYIGQSRVVLKYVLPLSEVVVDFYDQIKSVSSGYARLV